MKAIYISDPQKFLNYYRSNGSSYHPPINQYGGGGGLGNIFGSLQTHAIPLSQRHSNINKNESTKFTVQSPAGTSVDRAKEEVNRVGIRMKRKRENNSKKGMRKVKRRKKARRRKIVRNQRETRQDKLLGEVEIYLDCGNLNKNVSCT